MLEPAVALPSYRDGPCCGRTAGLSSALSPPLKVKKASLGLTGHYSVKGVALYRGLLYSQRVACLSFPFSQGWGPSGPSGPLGHPECPWMGENGVRHSLQRTIGAFSTRKGPGRRRWPRGSLNAGLKWVKPNSCLRNATCVDLLIWDQHCGGLCLEDRVGFYLKPVLSKTVTLHPLISGVRMEKD